MAQIFGTEDANDIDGTAGNDMIYGRGGDDIIDAGAGNDVLYGGAGNDTLYGGEGNDQLSGGEGADYMVGGDGNDTYYVDNIGDEVIEFSNGGIDRVVSSLANYALDTNAEILDLLEGAGNINGSGNDAANTLRGNSGNNQLHGRGGNDTVYGQGGDDVINGGEGNDLLDGGAGVDTISFKTTAAGGATVDLLITKAQNTGFGLDTIRNFENIEGTESADTLLGDNNANAIIGLGGDDTIRGRGGDDTITAGSGADTIIFEAAALNGVDRIRQFQSGVDTLQFSAADYDASATLTYGTAAVGAGAQFIFDDALDNLYYDADGAGGADAIWIATMATTTIVASDIVVI
ncbi:calcium-binding protein [Sphingobium algorifonticola]|uniref:Calcium-binding protein n=1 Tax=Sphingobium algorifonticola TaxID=2008318 RepID=A0A437J572_9SPHN|nr:calcium-binding protein [Sphingobium algorifonticola]RVT39899.1 calcium-binding protein [Sphingobium algorifonticola]